MDVKIEFEHHQAAHCETGATSNLLNFAGLKISEPMIFGIGGGLFFGYFPFVKLNYIPLTTFRHAPGRIFRKFTSRVNIKIHSQRFKSEQKAKDILDDLLSKGIPVALQTGAYWLPYFPSAYRFHFNMHNIVVYGRQNGSYLVSVPIWITRYRLVPRTYNAPALPAELWPPGENCTTRRIYRICLTCGR